MWLECCTHHSDIFVDMKHTIFNIWWWKAFLVRLYTFLISRLQSKPKGLILNSAFDSVKKLSKSFIVWRNLNAAFLFSILLRYYTVFKRQATVSIIIILYWFLFQSSFSPTSLFLDLFCYHDLCHRCQIVYGQFLQWLVILILCLRVSFSALPSFWPICLFLFIVLECSWNWLTFMSNSLATLFIVTL